MLALLAIVGGIVAIPQDDELARPLPRADVRATRRSSATPPTALLAFGLVLGAVVGLGGHRDRLRRVGRAAVARAGDRARASRGSPTLFEHKWYFDELIDALVVRPARVVRALRARTPSSG